MASAAVDTAAPGVDLAHKKAALNGSTKEPSTNAAASNGHTTELRSAPSNGHTEELHGAPSKIPLELSGVLDQFKSFDVTPVIGREFPNVSLADWLRAPNSDELLRDLAITSL